MGKESKKIVAGTQATSVSAEKDHVGQEHLKSEKWETMSMEGGQKVTGNSANTGIVNQYFEKVFTTLYGELDPDSRVRALWLGGTLFFIVGGYWLLRSLKDPVLATICGVEYIPKAKILSLFVVTGFVTVYNKLIDMFPKHQLFYIVGGFYAIAFSIIAACLAHPVWGVENTESSPYRILGWISYCTIESFGSIGVSLFWAFCNSAMNLEQAKSAYGLIVAGAQVGAICGPTVVTTLAESAGVPTCYFMGALCMACMCGMVYMYTNKFGIQDESTGDNGGKKKSKGGVLEGIKLFVEHNYVKGIFFISCFFMIEVTILDYSMKILAKNEFDAEYPGDSIAATKAFAAFMGRFGQATNTLSFSFSLLGTSFIIRRLGLNYTIIAFPTCCFAAICGVYMVPNLWTVFCAMLLLKGFSYSLNNPCKEILYQVTSKGTKFKAKSWIDVFGARGSKAAGSIVTNAFSDSATDLLTYGAYVAMGVSSFLIYVAWQMGKMFDEYIATGYIVGEEAPSAEELAKQAQLEGDTSLGIEEEGQTEDEQQVKV
mmetsp:Transcript_43635/g.118608  ORF Transcript_43635/g.118608 Transcript_43635/m.118608 type:complete len:542 (+) Transcript_43635:572-2197(+)|eukprot:CAMPEP_0119467670 /NCGR_PEP_ID=MMETSP1344-20130328/1751_1 /TAXON_ID=236787 /ORGANISM="Florenciella parvula, Strain CCMP2471" /LENGTH=541 /DNA_ID=CAMNT_0007500057 /DNA_START=236 /DNA_END=1861 /DNA_ORIENTATION=-